MAEKTPEVKYRQTPHVAASELVMRHQMREEMKCQNFLDDKSFVTNNNSSRASSRRENFKSVASTTEIVRKQIQKYTMAK